MKLHKHQLAASGGLNGPALAATPLAHTQPKQHGRSPRDHRHQQASPPPVSTVCATPTTRSEPLSAALRSRSPLVVGRHKPRASTMGEGVCTEGLSYEREVVFVVEVAGVLA